MAGNLRASLTLPMLLEQHYRRGAIDNAATQSYVTVSRPEAGCFANDNRARTSMASHEFAGEAPSSAVETKGSK